MRPRLTVQLRLLLVQLIGGGEELSEGLKVGLITRHLRTLGESLREVCGEFTTVVPRGSRWRYDDTGTVPDGAWTSASYEDAGWSAGRAPLGTGGGDVVTTVSLGPDLGATHPSTYFRHTFDLTTVEEGATWVLGLRADDAAAVYLNGEPLHRTPGLPEGTIGPEDLSTVGIRGYDEETYVEVTLETDLLQPGPNQLAVEVHQASTVDEDLVFDLFLKVRPEG